MRLAVAWTALLAAGSPCACSHSDSTVPPDASPDTSEDQTGLTGLTGLEDSAADVTPLALPSPLVGVRVANFSASAPAFDLCLAVKGTTNWIGPMVAAAGPQDPNALAPGVILTGDGGAAGLGFPGVSAYFYMPPGQYEARWVAAGSLQCPTVGVVPDTTLPMLSDGGLETIAWFDPTSAPDAGAGPSDGGPSDGGGGWEILPFADDLTLPPDSGAGFFGVRFINAAPTIPQANLGNSGPTGGVTLMFNAVPYPAESQPYETYGVGAPYVDGNGFLFAPPTIPGFTFVANFVGPQSYETLTTGPSNVAAGAVITIVLLAGGGSELSSMDGGAGEAPAFQLLQCVDNAGTTGVSGACSVISQ